MSQVLRVTFTVDYEADGPLPYASDQEASDMLVEALMDLAPDSAVAVGPCALEPVGWRVDAGPYGDMGIGQAPDRPTGPRPAACVAIPREPKQ